MNADIRLGDYREVLADVTFNLLVTSPPYNLGKPPTKGRQDGRRKNGEYDPKSFAGVTTYEDNLPEAEYQDQQVAFLQWAEQHMAPNGLICYNHKGRRRNKRIISPWEWINRVPGLVVREEVIWDRGGTHNHDKSQLWYQTERLWVLGRPEDAYGGFNSTDRGLTQRSDVWKIPVDSRMAGTVKHTAAFPEALVEAAILAWTNPGDVVMDPYVGSGTTAVVAARLGRQMVGAEVLPEVYEAAVARLHAA